MEWGTDFHFMPFDFGRKRPTRVVSREIDARNVSFLRRPP
jgi:hypothetical protein